MTEPKLCKNCVYYHPDRFLQIISFGLFTPFDTAKCVRPKTDLVSGGYKQRNFCSTERISYSTIDTCGIDAKYYYEARK